VGLRDAGTSRWFPSGFLQTEEIVSADAKGKLWDVQLWMRPDHPAAGIAVLWASHGDRSTPSTDPTSSGQGFFASRPTGNSFPQGLWFQSLRSSTRNQRKRKCPISSQHFASPQSRPSCPITVPSHVPCPQHHRAAGRAVWGLCTPVLHSFHSPFQPKWPQPSLPHKDSSGLLCDPMLSWHCSHTLRPSPYSKPQPGCTQLDPHHRGALPCALPQVLTPKHCTNAAPNPSACFPSPQMQGTHLLEVTQLSRDISCRCRSAQQGSYWSPQNQAGETMLKMHFCFK